MQRSMHSSSIDRLAAVARARPWLRLAIAVAGSTAALLFAPRAQAQDTGSIAPSGLAAGDISGLDQQRIYWRGSGPERGFLAATFDVAALRFRPRLVVGYGKPHWDWVGAETYADVSTSGGSMYVGLRGQLPQFGLRAGLRYEFPINQHFLQPKEDYNRFDLESERHGPSRYLSAEAELSGQYNLLGGNIFGVLSGYYLASVPEGVFLYEEQLRLVVEPPYLVRARAGYLAHFGWMGTLRIGAAAELLIAPERDAAIVRAGPAVNVSLTHHLQVTGAVMIVAASPDALGLDGADLGQLALRYRWATGDRWSSFP